MRRLIGWSGTVAVVGLLVLAVAAWGDDEKKAGQKKDAPKAQKIALDKVPPKIMSAVKARFPGAELTSVEKETEDGKVVFDIELKHQGRKYEMDIQEDGTIIEIEKQVDAKDLPEAVGKAIKAKFPDALIKEIMEVNKVNENKETPDHYEVIMVDKDKKEKEVTVSLDGKTINAEKK